MEPNRQLYFMAKSREYVKRKSEELGRNLTVHITTFGCQMNAKDSEKLLGILEKSDMKELMMKRLLIFDHEYLYCA